MTELRAEFSTLKTTAGGANPTRLRYIESLLCKAEKAEGRLASLLEDKVRTALSSYREQLEQECKAPAGQGRRPDSGLRDLIALLNEHHSNDEDPNLAPLEHTLRQQELELAGEIARQAPDALQQAQSGQEELRAARRFQSAMVRQNADKVVTQALAEIPEACGPLNPQRLATRSLQTMRDLSPHYLSRFVSYIDTLFWLENADRGK
jgi:Protein of unknown function (DUF2894)